MVAPALDNMTIILDDGHTTYLKLKVRKTVNLIVKRTNDLIV